MLTGDGILDIKVKISERDSSQLSEVSDLFKQEWSDFEFGKEQPNVPPVILALSGDVVVGALAYSLFKEPQKETKVVWIDAVFVLPEYRNKGIASTLIDTSIEQLTNYKQSYLYAYTNIPELYSALGWFVAEEGKILDNEVMAFKLN